MYLKIKNKQKLSNALDFLLPLKGVKIVVSDEKKESFFIDLIKISVFLKN